MASPQTAPAQLPVEQAQMSNGDSHAENGQDVAAVEQGMKELEVSRDGLHAACAEGRVVEVREMLSRGVDNLEVLGCTPIVLAIRNNHPEVVRELLQAGAIVPPPGVTNDQQMLSILYPPHMYGMPPFMQQPEFYPQPPFFTGPNPNFMPRQRKESDASQANLPPAEVAKTIPCRNFPSCKYGTNCIFFHPQNGPFFQPQPFGFEGRYQGFPQQGMGFPQPGFQQFPPHPENGAPVEPESFQGQPQPQPIPATNGMPPAFVPAFQQMPMSPPDFNSPISPSMLGNSLPSIPPAEQFFAAASPPPSGFMGMMPPPFVPMPPQNRRQSFNQFGLPPNGAPKAFPKKASFSGGPRPPFPTRPDYNKWKDGQPPACIFFMQNKCRNGEMCKFPHLDAEGTDSAIPPIPRVVRPVRPFEPSFKQQQFAFLQQQRAALQMAQKPQELETTPETTEPATPVDKGASTLPPKPVTALAPAPLVRSASQPGVQRVHVNGFNSRSQSPAPSNVSFHGGGHPKRNTSRPAFPVNGQVARSSSVSADPKANQRVPGADEFPALGGMESKQASPVARGRTAAEVLSAPAPEKPKAAVVEETSDNKSEQMDSDNESDGVVISVKPSSSTPTPAPAPAPKAPTMSFARMAGAMSSPAETAPIAVKA